MKRKKISSGFAIAALAGTLSFGLLSWDFKQKEGGVYIDENVTTDTIPTNRDRKVRDLDDVLKELDEAQFKFDKEFKLDMEKMKREMEEAFRKIDMDKMKIELEKGWKDIDFDKMKKEMEDSWAKVDWNKLEKEMEKVKEIEFSKIQEEMKKVEVEMKKVQEEMSKLGPEIERSMEKAKVELAKAKEEMKEYNNFVSQLEKDGLLKRSEGYTLRHEDGEFFINGKKQSVEVYNKYRSFLEKHKNFNIKKTDDDFDMDID